MREVGSTSKILEDKLKFSHNLEECCIGHYSYKYSNLLGSGYSSKVYKAYSSQDNKMYAMKVVELGKMGPSGK